MMTTTEVILGVHLDNNNNPNASKFFEIMKLLIYNLKHLNMVFRESDFTIPKPMISKERQHNNDVPERNFNQRDTPDRNFGHRDSPDRNFGHGSSPDRNFGQSKDFGAIDFNNRMKPPSAQGGSYKNPLFDQGPRDLENKYFAGPRDNHRTKPQPPAFKPPSSGFNQPNSLYPRK